ncbi:hypothetical protein Bacsa_3089 [Phocaeicola salanitronis DSM 18170]|uniref:Uncharacterized protein n=1 Tax=Phocaeicola salanitronis (strain DSM 18170 / JCM 13657 / CCUG 60908 / BL78) TaxID=667015 RepID=F0R356_PHOSB|nr:hypothetical protein [Phocaeicola salanitronis]ADY37617.1 hypothetical protein Bacsa_3089 [Phocaeicola salanitronis DSM 18170]
METNYIIILDYSVGEVIKIKLTKEQIEESEKYDDFETFLSTLEEVYDFRLKDCLWMCTESYQERSFGF